MHNRIVALTGISLLSASALTQQPAQAADGAEAGGGLDEVVVTGTRFADRTVTNGE